MYFAYLISISTIKFADGWLGSAFFLLQENGFRKDILNTL